MRCAFNLYCDLHGHGIGKTFGWLDVLSIPFVYLFRFHAEQTENSEGAPVHRSAAPARRFGLTLAIKLSSRCDAARRRDTEWSDLCQLRQLQWRSARAGGIIYLYQRSLQVIVGSRYFFLVNSFLQIFVNSISRATHFLGNSDFEFNQFDFPVGLMYIVIRSDLIRVDRFDILSMFLEARGSEDSQDFSEETSWTTMSEHWADFCFPLSTAGFAATEVRQFQKDRHEQARCEFNWVVPMNARTVFDSADIVSMKGSQFHKDRDEQARCEFNRVVSMNALTVFDSADILSKKVSQFQKNRDEQARCKFKRVVSMNARNFLESAEIVSRKVCRFQKDRDEQAWCEFKRVVSMNARIVIDSHDIASMKVCQIQKDRDKQAR